MNLREKLEELSINPESVQTALGLVDGLMISYLDWDWEYCSDIVKFIESRQKPIPEDFSLMDFQEACGGRVSICFYKIPPGQAVILAENEKSVWFRSMKTNKISMVSKSGIVGFTEPMSEEREKELFGYDEYEERTK